MFRLLLSSTSYLCVCWKDSISHQLNEENWKLLKRKHHPNLSKEPNLEFRMGKISHFLWISWSKREEKYGDFASSSIKSFQRWVLLIVKTFPKATKNPLLLLLFINWDVTQKSIQLCGLGQFDEKTAFKKWSLHEINYFRCGVEEAVMFDYLIILTNASWAVF